MPSLHDARDIAQETIALLWVQRVEFDAARPFFPERAGSGG